MRRRTGSLALVLCLGSFGAVRVSGQSASATKRVRDAPALLFEVATVKPSDPHRPGWRMQFTVNGFTARGVVLRQVIQEAYGTYEENRLEGGPAWLKTTAFDIEAKIGAGQDTVFADLSLEQRRAMLQALLADRFKLAIHRESRELPVYALVVAKGGPKLQESDPRTAFHGEIKGMDTLIRESGRGHFKGENFTMAGLALHISPTVGRIVVDRTGLAGRYDVALRWTPDDVAVRGSGEPAVDAGVDAPSFFQAVQEQLGLKLEPTKSAVEVIVVDHVEMPTEN